MTPIYYVFADILGRRQYFMILPDFVAANICVYFQYLSMHVSMHQYFWRSCFNLRFKINVVVMIIRSLELLLILSEPFKFPPLVYPIIARLAK
jgi:hypothetical protein